MRRKKRTISLAHSRNWRWDLETMRSKLTSARINHQSSSSFPTPNSNQTKNRQCRLISRKFVSLTDQLQQLKQCQSQSSAHLLKRDGWSRTLPKFRQVQKLKPYSTHGRIVGNQTPISTQLIIQGHRTTMHTLKIHSTLSRGQSTLDSALYKNETLF